MGRTSFSMRPLARPIRSAGYDVLNWSYSSIRSSVAESGARLAKELQTERYSSARRIHFIGHSLGCIIIRWVLSNTDVASRAGSVILLAPPNRGAAKADRATRWWGWLLKPLAELQTSGSTVRDLVTPTDVRIGIIAGLYDGKVTVAETQLSGATEHVCVPAVHSFLMLRRDVQELVLRFLTAGTFAADNGEGT